MINNFYENDLLREYYTCPNTLLRVISFPKMDDNLKNYVKKFLNLSTFPYVNALYGQLIKCSYDELPEHEKAALLYLLKAQIKEIDKREKKQIYTAQMCELIEKTCINITEKTTKADIYSSIRGGQYGEMFLCYLLISLGFEKILSKLYLEWGPLSPTGIDAPYIDIENKVLVLAESKIYKSISSAVRSVMKDVNNIYNNNKFDLEVDEWLKKIAMMPETVQTYLLENKLDTKSKIVSNMNKIYIIGFVMGNCNENDIDCIKEIIDNIEDFEEREKYELLLLVVPLKSKDNFIQCCIEVIDDMIYEVEVI